MPQCVSWAVSWAVSLLCRKAFDLGACAVSLAVSLIVSWAVPLAVSQSAACPTGGDVGGDVGTASVSKIGRRACRKGGEGRAGWRWLRRERACFPRPLLGARFRVLPMPCARSRSPARRRFRAPAPAVLVAAFIARCRRCWRSLRSAASSRHCARACAVPRLRRRLSARSVLRHGKPSSTAPSKRLYKQAHSRLVAAASHRAQQPNACQQSPAAA